MPVDNYVPTELELELLWRSARAAEPDEGIWFADDVQSETGSAANRKDYSYNYSTNAHTSFLTLR